jgi:hypothetical protein
MSSGSAEQRAIAAHVLAALAYRTQKALRGAPAGFGDFDAGSGVRTPAELVRHMTSVLGYARTFFIGGIFQPKPLDSLDAEVQRFHEIMADLAAHVRAGTDLRDITLTQLVQGPISDAITHAGQIALLRRLAGSPVESENFIFAEISVDNLGSAQPLPAAPDSKWLGKIIHWMWLLHRRTRR